MLGALITLVFCLGVAGLGSWLLRRWLEPLDPAAKLGLAGLFGLGLIGTVMLFLGLLPSGISLAVGMSVLAALAGFVLGKPWEQRLTKPESLELAFVAGIGVAVLMAFVGTLAPPDINEWDSLAYHLAVPKIWIEQGQITPVPGIHHSNFPFAFDNLYILGLTWGGHAGAKAFVLASLVFGLMALFGIARQVYGKQAGWWAALTFVTAPVVLWLTGTAYIDVPNGLYAGLGIVLAALYVRQPDERRYLWLAAVSLGLAMGTKYTGLQTLFAVGLVLLLAMGARKRLGEGLKLGTMAAGLALLIALPWFAKNVAWVQNPVYPFFYERLGGKDWDARRAEIYQREQRTFGVARPESEGFQREVKPGLDFSKFGHAVLGLAYQPGRFVNPGQTQGAGNPLGAIGVAVLASLLGWMISGRGKSFELTQIAVILLSFAMWFVLSQQSRYIVTLAVPLAIMLGGGILRLKIGQLLGFVAAAQAVYSLYLLNASHLQAQLMLLTGRTSQAEYQQTRIPLYESAVEINANLKDAKIALYDEVFGYVLDVPYFWANPGHSTIIPYDSLNTGAELAQWFRDNGFTHVYISTSPVVRSQDNTRRMLATMGLAPAAEPYTQPELEGMRQNWEQKHMPLLMEAVAQKQLVPIMGKSNGILFQVQPQG
jgi:4-amino-4-deoxy-L-arabinose transferase-like glycosyltransferase